MDVVKIIIIVNIETTWSIIFINYYCLTWYCVLLNSVNGKTRKK